MDRLLSRAIASARTRIAYSVPESDGWRRMVNRARWFLEDSWQPMLGLRPFAGYFHSIRRIDAQLVAPSAYAPMALQDVAAGDLRAAYRTIDEASTLSR
jgi:hypothetical protein